MADVSAPRKSPSVALQWCQGVCMGDSNLGLDVLRFPTAGTGGFLFFYFLSKCLQATSFRLLELALPHREAAASKH